MGFSVIVIIKLPVVHAKYSWQIEEEEEREGKELTEHPHHASVATTTTSSSNEGTSSSSSTSAGNNGSGLSNIQPQMSVTAVDTVTQAATILKGNKDIEEATKDVAPVQPVHVFQADELTNLKVAFKNKLKEFKLYNRVSSYFEVSENKQPIQNFQFHCNSDISERLFDELRDLGIGTKYGQIFILPVELCRTQEFPESSEEDTPKDPEPKTQAAVANDSSSTPLSSTKKLYVPGAHTIKTAMATRKDRVALENIVESVRRSSEPTFDFISMIIFAAAIAASGLATDSVVSLIAAMLVSPLMGPILGFTFGTLLQDGKMILVGFKTTMLGLFLCFLSGLIFGCFWIPLIGDSLPGSCDNLQPDDLVEMCARGAPSAVWKSATVAVPSGLAVAMSMLGSNSAGLVGVAISASLLPPAVNTGMLLIYAAIGQNYHVNDGVIVDSISICESAGISLSITIVNIVCIYFFAIAMFYVKAAVPNQSSFWKEAVPYYKNLSKQSGRFWLFANDPLEKLKKSVSDGSTFSFRHTSPYEYFQEKRIYLEKKTKENAEKKN